jgi:CRP/FNR family transcriptional regulator
MAHAGQTVGYRGFFSGGAYSATAELIQAGTVCRIGKDALRTALAHNPSLGLQFLAHVGRDLDDAEESLLKQSSLPVRIRVVHLLLSLKERFGEMRDGGMLAIALPMARQDMAALLGTRPETIARTLRELQDDHVVSFDGRTALVADLDTLLDEIEPFPA